MPTITVYTTKICSYCNSAKRLLTQRGLDFEEIGLDDKPELRQKLAAENGGYRTVPMIFIGEEFIGGYTELAALDRNGGLATRVKGS
jgi:glutaredoxin 3